MMLGVPDTRTVGAFLGEGHPKLACEVAGFCDEEIAPLAAPESDDAGREQARDILRRLGAGGRLEVIERQDLRGCCLTREGLAAASPLADAVFALQALAATPILLAGSNELKTRWAAAAIRGEAMGAFAMTEPEAGSDVGAIATRAVREGEDYLLTGTKTFISNAGIADFYTVFASTEPERGTRGLSCFVVPADSPGLRFVRPLVLAAPHPLGEIAFERCRVPASHRLGDENAGFKLGMSTLDRLRPTVAAAAIGMGARALREALGHAARRKQFGSPLASYQLVQEKLARMAIDLAAARLLTYRAAAEHDRGAERITVEAAMAKAFATEAAQRVIDDAVQILGGRGVMADHPVDRLYRAIRALRIYEGTTGIQHLVIARHLVDQGGGVRDEG